MISIVILNYNAEQYVGQCIQSVIDAGYYDIVVIDNGSTDNSHKVIKKFIKKINYKRLPENIGVSKALNLGVNLTRGEWITFLASDTTLDKNFYNNIIPENPKQGAYGAKVLEMFNHNKIDSVGEFMTPWGFLYQRHKGKEINCGYFDSYHYIFSHKGTALTVNREAFCEVSGFDENFFMYLEDTDLCWRLWLKGYFVTYNPKAIICHAGSHSINNSPDRKKLVNYYGSRNYLIMVAKNSKMLPKHLLLWILLAIYKRDKYIFKGIWDFLWNMPKEHTEGHLPNGLIYNIPLSYLIERGRSWK